MDWRLILLIILLFGGMSYVDHQGDMVWENAVNKWNKELKDKGEI